MATDEIDALDQHLEPMLDLLTEKCQENTRVSARTTIGAIDFEIAVDRRATGQTATAVQEPEVKRPEQPKRPDLPDGYVWHFVKRLDKEWAIHLIKLDARSSSDGSMPAGFVRQDSGAWVDSKQDGGVHPPNWIMGPELSATLGDYALRLRQSQDGLPSPELAAEIRWYHFMKYLQTSYVQVRLDLEHAMIEGTNRLALPKYYTEEDAEPLVKSLRESGWSTSLERSGTGHIVLDFRPPRG